MKRRKTYAVLGLCALRRAAAKVAADANRNNYKVPFWEDGKVVYKKPTVPSVEQVSVVAESAAPWETTGQ